MNLEWYFFIRVRRKFIFIYFSGFFLSILVGKLDIILFGDMGKVFVFDGSELIVLVFFVYGWYGLVKLCSFCFKVKFRF